MYSLRLSMLSGSGFAINVAEDALELSLALDNAINNNLPLLLKAVDGTGTVLMLNPCQVDGWMHSPKLA